MNSSPIASAPSPRQHAPADGGSATGAVRWWPDGLVLPVEGPAYSSLHRLVATAMMMTLLTLLWRAVPEIAAGVDRQWAGVWLLPALAAAGVAAGYATVMLARTRVTTEAIEQLRPFRREVRLIDITQAKLVYVPRLAWLIAPRLTLRSGGAAASVFRTADPTVLAALVAIALAAASGQFAQARATLQK